MSEIWLIAGESCKLWLWKHGDHFLAFDNPCPTHDGGDPMTLGDPVAVAILTPSTPGWAKDEKGNYVDPRKGTTHHGR